ncbi:hypothetical protein cand_010220 [Cryptosporidium andersoni]|uniref:Uncharacterized protein n=1 Tax=Cryptosporidium andersoni TaxID=117008 RepID=A0A1J4MF47_9CRYT|nr:hypothetical protein cand_010220 [Cryptosporidium andersoni]
MFGIVGEGTKYVKKKQEKDISRIMGKYPESIVKLNDKDISMIEKKITGYQLDVLEAQKIALEKDKELYNLRYCYDSSKANVEYLENRCKKLEFELKSLAMGIGIGKKEKEQQREIERLRKEASQFINIKSEAEKQKKYFSDRCMYLDHELEKLRDELASKVAELESMTKLYQELRIEQEKTKGDLDSMTAKCKYLEDEISKKNNAILQIQTNVKSKEIEIQKLQDKIKEKEEQIIKLNDSIKNKELDINQLIEDLNNKDIECKNLTDKIKLIEIELDDNKKELKESCEINETKISGLNIEVENLKSEITEKDNQLKVLEQIKSEVQNKAKQLEDLKKLNNELLEKSNDSINLKKLESDLKDKDELINSLNQQIELLNNKLEIVNKKSSENNVIDSNKTSVQIQNIILTKISQVKEEILPNFQESNLESIKSIDLININKDISEENEEIERQINMNDLPTYRIDTGIPIEREIYQLKEKLKQYETNYILLQKKLDENLKIIDSKSREINQLNMKLNELIIDQPNKDINLINISSNQLKQYSDRKYNILLKVIKLQKVEIKRSIEYNSNRILNKNIVKIDITQKSPENSNNINFNQINENIFTNKTKDYIKFGDIYKNKVEKSESENKKMKIKGKEEKEKEIGGETEEETEKEIRKKTETKKEIGDETEKEIGKKTEKETETETEKGEKMKGKETRKEIEKDTRKKTETEKEIGEIEKEEMKQKKKLKRR